MTDRDRAQHAADLLIRHRYREVAQFVETNYGRTLVTAEDVRRSLQQIDVHAQDHNAEYAAGMRHARLIIEQELLGNGSER